jgi:hypothetical protein
LGDVVIIEADMHSHAERGNERNDPFDRFLLVPTLLRGNAD